MHSRHLAGYDWLMQSSLMLRLIKSVALASVLVAAVAVPSLAQQRDTSTASQPAGPAPELRPPLSPRRAFLYGLLLPGYPETVLGRNRSASLLMAFEAVSLIMIRESAGSLREARRNLADSVIVSYVDAAGLPAPVWQKTPFSRALVKARQEQVEDWIAVLIGNHLFAGADAYVASLLWDLPAEVAFRASRHSTGLALRLYW